MTQARDRLGRFAGGRAALNNSRKQRLAERLTRDAEITARG
jgi:hypothetical protein